MQFLGTLTYLIEMDYGLHIKGLDKSRKTNNFVINEKNSFRGRKPHIPNRADEPDSSIENSFEHKGFLLLDVI